MEYLIYLWRFITLVYIIDILILFDRFNLDTNSLLIYVLTYLIPLPTYIGYHLFLSTVTHRYYKPINNKIIVISSFKEFIGFIVNCLYNTMKNHDFRLMTTLNLMFSPSLPSHTIYVYMGMLVSILLLLFW